MGPSSAGVESQPGTPPPDGHTTLSPSPDSPARFCPQLAQPTWTTNTHATLRTGPHKSAKQVYIPKVLSPSPLGARARASLSRLSRLSRLSLDTAQLQALPKVFVLPSRAPTPTLRSLGPQTDIPTSPLERALVPARARPPQQTLPRRRQRQSRLSLGAQAASCACAPRLSFAVPPPPSGVWGLQIETSTPGSPCELRPALQNEAE